MKGTGSLTNVMASVNTITTMVTSILGIGEVIGRMVLER